MRRSLAQFDHQLQVDNVCPERSIVNMAGVFNDAQLDDADALSNLHFMLGHCRPPDHKRKLE